MRRYLIVALCATAVSAIERQSVSLTGTWQRVAVASLDAAPPADGWREVMIPSEQGGYDYGAAWFRRSFDVPAAWQGRRVVLRFGGVKWNSRVLVNGTRVGGCFNGQDAFTCDITRAVRTGANELLVGATDWTGVFDPAQPRVEWSKTAELRQQPKDRVIAPIGGHVTTFGIWDEVTLEATAPVHAAQVSVRTSVRQERLTVLVDVAGPVAQTSVSGTVTAAGSRQTVVTLPTKTVNAPSTIELTVPWTDPRPWSFEDPFLYELHLATGDDQQTIRFGFRELWCNGPDFYLNGHKVHLLASSWWPQTQFEPIEDVRTKLRALKQVGVTTFRTHTQPWREQWYTVADELGILMIPEGAVWNDDSVYRLDDPRFWDHYREHLQTMARHLGNHASVVMWSLENEFFGQHINNQTPEREARLAALADAVREVDPTRPITYESDGDPGGKADVIGLHYPNEWPREYQWPNCADWLDEPKANTGGGGAFWPEKDFLWKRNKPLYIGEFLWVPSNNPDTSTIFCGDAAYASYHDQKVKAKADSWYWQILAYRRGEVSGISPWTVIEGGPLDDRNPCYVAHERAYQHVAAYPREFDHRFFAGETVARTFDVYNDSLKPAWIGLSVAWTATGGTPTGQSWREPPVEMPPGSHRVVNVELTAPADAKRLSWQIASRKGIGGGAVLWHGDDLGVEIAQPAVTVAPSGTGLFDPQSTARPLRGMSPVTSLDGALPKLLVVAPNALADQTDETVPVIGGTGGLGERLRQYVEHGGKLLVFSQSSLPKGLFGLSATTRNSTLAHLGLQHPVTAGLPDDAFQLWHGDHFVTRMELRRPVAGGTVPLVVTGSATGLDHVAVLEVRSGAGCAIFCGLRIPEKLATEPMAAEMLHRMLAYLDSYQRQVPQTVLDCDDPAARQVLDTIGLQAVPGTAPAGAQLAILHQPQDLAGRAAGLRRYVEAGGKLLLSQVAPSDSPALAALGLEGIRLTASSAPVTLAERSAAPLFGQLFREDLYWLGSPTPGVVSWATLPRAGNQAVAVVAPALDPATATVYECEAMAIAGTIVRVEGNHVAMATAGTASGRCSVAADGEYVLAVRGWGTPAAGVWPQIQILVDGRPAGMVQLEGREPTVAGAAVRLKAGEHAVELRFVNDQQLDHEDRNAYLDALLVAPSSVEMSDAALTSPPAVFSRRVGNGLVVVDEIRWQDAPGNTDKARRHIASVLTAMGAECRAPGGTVIEAETFTIQPGLQHNRADSGFQTMAQAGWIEREVEIAKAGRYRLTITARGSVAADSWPHAALTLDGQPLAEVTVPSSSWDEYPLEVELPAGRHVLRLEFDNDLNSGGQDRNLFVDRFRFEAR